MNLIKAKLSGLVLGVGVLAPTSGAAVFFDVPSFVITEPEEELKQLEGSITSVDEERHSFVIKDDERKDHSVKTNEKTRYMVDGEKATRAQVVAEGADVEAEINKEGYARSVNRMTE